MFYHTNIDLKATYSKFIENNILHNVIFFLLSIVKNSVANS